MHNSLYAASSHWICFLRLLTMVGWCRGRGEEKKARSEDSKALGRR
jgi:hypothetical protein